MRGTCSHAEPRGVVPGPRAIAALALSLILLGVAAPGCGRVARTRLGMQLKTGAGMAAKQMCSLVFVSGLKPERARALYIDPILGRGASVVRLSIDEETSSVTASVRGVLDVHARHREGVGCTIAFRDGPELEPVLHEPRGSRPMVLDASHRDAYFDVTKLDTALDRAFAEPDPDLPANTLAVVVLHQGRLVAERYAEGIGPETRLPGWSMSKSVTATLAGVLVHLGRLDPYAPGILREWRGTADPRASLTLDHLLRMTSGLALEETGDRGDGLDPTSILLYHRADAAHFAATREPLHAPGVHFEYMSGSYVLAARALQEAIGGGLQETLAFLHEHFFGPLGMHSAVFEADQTGTLLGSSHMLATARDWARFGQLYVDGGIAGERRLLSDDWIQYVATPTPASRADARGGVFWEPERSAYGAGFWLLGSTGGSGLPADGFDANGFQGQYAHILPSSELVVVRLGATNTRDYDHNALPRRVVEALRR